MPRWELTESMTVVLSLPQMALWLNRARTEQAIWETTYNDNDVGASEMWMSVNDGADSIAINAPC